MRDEALVRLEGVAKSYGGRDSKIEALADLSFEVGAGEFVVVIGPSGCGKTTLLKLIAGLILPTQGKIILCNKEVNGPIRDVGMVFQTPVLLQWRRVIDNVLLPIEVLGGDRAHYRRRALELLEVVGIAEFAERWPWELSAGMQQRASLCRALIHDPPLLLMDEPYAMLDALTREEMDLELLRIWNERRKTVILVTHDIEEAVLLAERIIILTPRPGQIAARVPVELPRPRTSALKEMPEYRRLCSALRDKLSKNRCTCANLADAV